MSVIQKEIVASFDVLIKDGGVWAQRKGSEIVLELAEILGVDSLDDIDEGIAEQYSSKTIKELYREHDHAPIHCVSLFLEGVDGDYDVGVEWRDRETLESIKVFRVEVEGV